MAKDPRIASFSPIALRALSRLALVAAVGLLLGLVLGEVALALAIAFGLYAAFQLWNLLRLEHWLRRRRTMAPPDIAGPWGEIVAIVSRIYRRKQHHKTRNVALLREFRRLTSAMPEGAILLGPENQILWFNRHAAEWLQLRRKRDFGIRIENLIRHPDFVAYLRRDELGGGVIIQHSVESDLWLSLHLVSTPNAARRLLIVRNVSREVRIESVRKDFVANASHELRSPLTVISGYLDALADDQQLDSTWNAPVQEMRRQAERMSLILKDLLELSKLEGKVQTVAGDPIDIAGLLALKRREVMSLERRPRVVEVKIDSTEWLRGTESEIHSIVDNLVTNAVKYTPVEGSVQMRWWVDSKGAHIAIRDTGIGIAPDHIPRLTERFYRVDAGRARDMGGSGLGLAIVKHALQRHQATLEVQSVEGQGSTFTCHFPPERIVNREQLLETTWGTEATASDRLSATE